MPRAKRVRKHVVRFSPYPVVERLVSDDEVLEFIDAVASVAPTHDDWKGIGIGVSSMDLKATDEQRKAVNRIGKGFGCHSCLTKVETDADQPWIGDHCPPTSLSDAARQALGLPSETYDGTVKLRPQCDTCSVTQAATVARVNSEVDQGRKPSLNTLGEILVGKRPGRHVKGIDATGPRVSPSQGDSIQKLGTVHGCHSCKNLYPKDYYHADHNPPVCYTFSHVIAILKYAKANIDECEDIEITQEFTLKPQCPRCSHAQGGQMNALSIKGKDIARRLGLAVY